MARAKFSVPSAPLLVLRRPRLFARLTDAVSHRVTAVSAPAGSGKTVLLSTWLHETNPLPAAWLSLDIGDNDPWLFWSCVLRSLSRACPSAAGALADLPVPQQVDDAFVRRFVDAAAQFTEPAVLILDDVHKLHHPALVASLDTLLRHAPQQLRLVLSGRSEPAVPMARLRVSGDLVDLGFDDLAFTEGEARQLFGLLETGLTPAEIGIVLERTEGWVAGLRLAGLWWAAQPGGPRDIAEFGGEVRIVADYLREEVMQALSPQARLFLLQTCLVDPVHGALADALTGKHDGARWLDQLERENALVTAVDPRRNRFRYRTLLRDFLRSELNRIMPEMVPELYRRAASRFSGESEIIEGMRSALRADDTALATDLLVDHGHRLLVTGHAAELEPLVTHIPSAMLRSDSRLAALCAQLRLELADPDGAEPYLRVAESAPQPGTGDQNAVLSAQVNNAYLRLLQASLRGRVGHEEINIAHEVLDRAIKANLLPGEQSELGRLAFHLALAHLWRGEGIAARVVLERGLRQQDVEADSAWSRRAMAWHVLLSAWEGRLVAADETIAKLRATGEDHEPDAAGERTLIDLAMAQVATERDALHEAWTLVDRDPAGPGLPLTEGGEVPVAALAALLRAKIMIARGQYSGARQDLAVARRPAEISADHPLWHAAGLLELRILLQESRTGDARRLFDSCFADRPVGGRASALVVEGQLRLAESDAEGAIASVAPCLDATASETRLLDTVAAHLVMAGARRRLGAPAEAKLHVERALALAEPDGLLRVFLEAGRGIRSTLTVMISDDGAHAHLRATILQHFDAQFVAATIGSRTARPLTGSEAAVLQYLPSLLTYEEIAGDLCLSVNTIKSHLRSLYRKLDVANRREAITKARLLSLLAPQQPVGGQARGGSYPNFGAPVTRSG